MAAQSFDPQAIRSGGARLPRLGVLALVVRGPHFLLVQRRNPPDAGLWGFPGGKVEFGEPLMAAAARELQEETGVLADFAPTPAGDAEIIGSFEVITHTADGQPDHHFLLAAVAGRWRAGEPVAADDALDARWFTLDDLPLLPRSRRVDDYAARLLRWADRR